MLIEDCVDRGEAGTRPYTPALEHTSTRSPAPRNTPQPKLTQAQCVCVLGLRAVLLKPTAAVQAVGNLANIQGHTHNSECLMLTVSSKGHAGAAIHSASPPHRNPTAPFAPRTNLTSLSASTCVYSRCAPQWCTALLIAARMTCFPTPSPLCSSATTTFTR